MKINCQVAQDLLPLYLDEVCSNESRQLVEDHLRSCEKCRKLIDSTQIAPIPNIEPEKETADQAVKHGFRKIRTRWIISVVLAIVVISTAFVGWNHYQRSQQAQQPEYEIAIAFMEQLKQGDYEKVFPYFDLDVLKEEWLRDWFEESELADFDQRALSIFLQYADKIDALGGIQQYEYIGMEFIGYREDGTPVYRLLFRVLFDGNARTFDLHVTEAGIDHISADGSFVTDPLTQFSIWSEYLWQDYSGCYFDPESGKYVYTTPKE